MYKERPEFLAYHEKSYHLLDIKPCKPSQVGCVCPDISFGDFIMKHLPSCLLSTTSSEFLSAVDTAACSFQREEANSPPSSGCNVSTLPSYKQEKWEYVTEDSKKIKQFKTESF